MPFTLHIHLPLAECVQQLQDAVDSQQGEFYIRLRSNNGDHYTIQIIHHQRWVKNSFTPMFWGKLQSNDSGCVLTGTFHMHPMILFICWGWLIAASIGILPTILNFFQQYATGTSNANFGQLIGVLLCWPGGGIALFAVGRFGNTDERAIKNLLLTTFAANVVSP